MKKIFMCLLVVLLSASVYSQNYKNDGQPYAFYCQLKGYENLAGQLRLKILWNNMKEENNLRDKDGKKIEFSTMVDAMNYMSKRGWEYVDNVIYKDGSHNVVHYIFKKIVTKDEDAKEGLYFETDFKNKEKEG